MIAGFIFRLFFVADGSGIWRLIAQTGNGESLTLTFCYYTGHTDNLENRLMQHHHKMFPTCFTATRLPVHLVFSQEFSTREEALASERQIKGWSRKKKEALIQGGGDLIKDALRDGAIAPPQGERL